MAAPGDVLVGSRQHQGVAIKDGRAVFFDIENPERHAFRARGSLQRRNIERRIEPQQRKLRPHFIVKRATLLAPYMRGAAPRHARRRVAVHRIGRMLGAVIGDDRRAIVVSAEVETGAGILLDVDLVGETADFPPRQRIEAGAQPLRCAASSQDRFMASAIPAFMP
jgi:hypothetical protein